MNAQQYPHQYSDKPYSAFSPQGVCTINGNVFYGHECWCYSDGLGTMLIVGSIISLIIIFFVNGCIWAGIFTCYKYARRGDD